MTPNESPPGGGYRSRRTWAAALEGSVSQVGGPDGAAVQQDRLIRHRTEQASVRTLYGSLRNR